LRDVVARMVFTRPFRALLGCFGGAPARLLLEPFLRWGFGTWKDRF